jgi:hypothetical protein
MLGLHGQLRPACEPDLSGTRTRSISYDVELTLRIEDQEIMTPMITWPDDFPSNSNESSRIPIEGAS